MATKFKACQSVEIPVPYEPIPIKHYLRQPQRLVNALVDSSRIEQLSTEVFRLKMRPLSFLSLSIQPIVDMRVWALADGTIRLESVNSEIRGIEYINQRFQLDLKGYLSSYEKDGNTYLKGIANLEVKVEFPPPLSFTPKSILEAAGNSLLKSVLLTIKQRLLHQLLIDYRHWVELHSIDKSYLDSDGNDFTVFKPE
ncbi:DUF1997 domain-containing protein [Plectonema cf. radiosum LEGE 06105]|uniref:DUF1997 domain-containing protein n=1 Tax=Plectonema cf. radiosum LEGE 06105 TaxID=945769 RepID=A0A8J7F2A4_9CYAN|nr:DUF1997 domain-containing protein [Plectonema radiosum]MBE9214851.1 DUF1997 domain-containing protein [Plectonema cf. radiosum LEGE 06105]